MKELLPYARFARSLGISSYDVCSEIKNHPDDFEVDGYRFIREDEIDEIQQDELSGDEYMLGCFNAWFLADVIGVDEDAITAMQQAEAYEAIGKLILSGGHLQRLQERYASADGYGHHFSHYDGSEEQIGEYLVFRVQ